MSSFLHFLLSDMGVTHPVLEENLVWWPFPSPKGLWEMQSLTGPLFTHLKCTCCGRLQNGFEGVAGKLPYLVLGKSSVLS